jgi:hypothetical protein
MTTGSKTNLSDEARRDINSVRVVSGDRNSDEFALPVRRPSTAWPRRDGAEIVKWVDDHGGAGLATAKFLGAHVVRAFNAISYILSRRGVGESHARRSQTDSSVRVIHPDAAL